MLKMKQAGGFAICLIVLLGYGIGLFKFMTEFEKDKCEMTYMFEYPQFVRISNEMDKIYSRYGLYVYSEGRLTSRARNMYFDGIPVLFIPGNAGSYKQVRSLSSVALRKTYGQRTPFHFDYFTIDLNYELSGLYGPLLYDQLNYVNSSLYRILQLYRDRENKPESVIIIGHSMGGVIALNLLSKISDPKLIPILITLAAPLKRPPIILDYHLQSFYNDFRGIPETTTVVSLSGGYRDFLILPYLSGMRYNRSIYAVTTSVPLAWTETSHVDIVWCKQLVLALNRALFDSVNLERKQISRNSTYRNMVFNHHLIHHSGIKMANLRKYQSSVEINNKGQWSESILKQYSVEHLHGVREPYWYMVKLSSLPGYEILTLLAINLEVVDWVYACNANYPRGPSRVCVDAVHLTHFSEIAPSVKYKRRYFQINMYQLNINHPDLTHVVFRALITSEPVVFHVDVHGSDERRITVDLPKWWSFQKHIIIEETTQKALHYELVLPQLQHVVQYYLVFVEPLSCSAANHHATASLLVPWNNETYHGYFTKSEKRPFHVRLYSSKPATANMPPAVLKFILDPACVYRISIEKSIYGTLGQLSRHYTPLLLTNIAVVVLMCLKHQLTSLRNGHCSIIFVAMKEGAKPYYIVTGVKLLTHFLNGTRLPSFLPKPDTFYLIEEGTDFFLLPLLLYLCSVGIVWCSAVIFGISLIAMESTAHKLALKLLAYSISFNIGWSDYVMKVLHKVPFIVASTLILLCLTTCGSLALCLGAMFYFLRLTQMSQDYIEEVVWFLVEKLAVVCTKIFVKNKLRKETEVKESLENISKASTSITEETGSETVPTIQVGKLEQETCEETSHIESVKNEEQEQVEDNDCDSEGNLEVEEKNLDVTNTLKSEIKNQENETLSNRFLSASYNAIFFHSTLFFLWCIITVINLPAVLTWAHNFKFSRALSPDDSFVPGLALSICAIPLWQCEFPKTDRKWLDKLESIIMIMATLSLTFGTISVYRLNFILTFTIVIITVHQLFAPKIHNLASEQENSDPDNARVKFGTYKAKLD